MAYKALWLDLDGNLHDSAKFWERAASNAVDRMIKAGLPATFDEAMHAYREIYKQDANGQYHLDDLVERFGRKGDLRLVMEGVNGYHETKYDPKQFHPYAGVRQLIQEAKAKGLELHIVTDGKPRKQWDKIVRLGLSEHFPTENVHLTQKEVGNKIEKRPKDISFYRSVLRKTKLKAKEVIYIGDHEHKDIVPAHTLGIHTIRHLTGKYANEQPRTVANHAVRDIHAARRIVLRLVR